MMWMAGGLLALWAVGVPVTASAFEPERLLEPWPRQVGPDEVRVEDVTFQSHSPFGLTDVDSGEDMPTTALGRLFLPSGATASAPRPAVILLHGASGVGYARELTYGPQLAAMGVAALVIDVFGARRDRARSFVDRILNITESMFLADAFSGLRYLDERPEIDGDRVVLIGFSYGGMAAVFSAYAQVAAAFAEDGERFAGHVAFYGPCIARFEAPETTRRPVLMLFGAEDEIMDQRRCAEIASDLETGGSRVQMTVYQDAYHQWDGSRSAWRAPRHLADCSFTVDQGGKVKDDDTFLAMSGPFTRKIILGLCSDSDGYVIAADAAIRERSNRDLGRFLATVLAPDAVASGTSGLGPRTPQTE